MVHVVAFVVSCRVVRAGGVIGGTPNLHYCKDYDYAVPCCLCYMPLLGEVEACTMCCCRPLWMATLPHTRVRTAGPVPEEPSPLANTTTVSQGTRHSRRGRRMHARLGLVSMDPSTACPDCRSEAPRSSPALLPHGSAVELPVSGDASTSRDNEAGSCPSRAYPKPSSGLRPAGTDRGRASEKATQ